MSIQECIIDNLRADPDGPDGPYTNNAPLVRLSAAFVGNNFVVSSAGTNDPDNDKLTPDWELKYYDVNGAIIAGGFNWGSGQPLAGFQDPAPATAKFARVKFLAGDEHGRQDGADIYVGE